MAAAKKSLTLAGCSRRSVCDRAPSRCLVGLAAARRSQAPIARIISLIPAVTEMLFAIGAGPQVVAVSSFDKYPPDVKDLPRVGALLDPNVERILSLKPDLVVVYGSQNDLKQQLARASIPIFDYRHAGLADVATTIRLLGQRTDHQAERRRRREADRAAAGRRLRRKVAGRPRPRDLLVFGRDPGTLRGIYASGGVGFLDDMLRVAGGDNVFADVKQQAVEASTELILARRPDVILEISGSSDSAQTSAADSERAAWGTLASVPAVRNGPHRDHPRRSDRRAGAARRRRHRGARSGASSRGVPDEDSGLVEQRQGQRVDAARAADSEGIGEVGGLLTSINADVQRVSMHGVREEVLRAQAARRRPAADHDSAALPVLQRDLRNRGCSMRCRRPSPRDSPMSRLATCSSRMSGSIGRIAWRELDSRPIFPLWGLDTRTLAREMIAAGLSARIVCLDPRVLPRELIGSPFDAPPARRPATGRGSRAASTESFTPVRPPVRCSPPAAGGSGKTVERDGFVFGDLRAERLLS